MLMPTMIEGEGDILKRGSKIEEREPSRVVYWLSLQEMREFSAAVV
jgi:hypothetical protein